MTVVAQVCFLGSVRRPRASHKTTKVAIFVVFFLFLWYFFLCSSRAYEASHTPSAQRGRHTQYAAGFGAAAGLVASEVLPQRFR
jgi:hypothetical protein